jgi:hypothetical protein
MAFDTMAEGATTLAAASFATGFADNAEILIPLTGQTITGGLDHSALGEGVNRLVVKGTGFIGPTDASDWLKVDVDYVTGPETLGAWTSALSTRPYAANFMTGGIWRYAATGDNNLCNHFFGNTSASQILLGGTFSTVDWNRGTLSVNTSTTLTTLNQRGGTVITELKTGSLTTYNIYSGVANLKRAATTINIYGGTVNYYVTSGTTTTVNHFGPTGVFNHQCGAITTYNGQMGKYDGSKMTRASAITTFNLTSMFDFIGSDLLTTTRVGLDPLVEV